MDEQARTQVSKFLSLVLRHKPETIGIVLDREGWVPVDTLLAACRAHGRDISRARLDDIVATNPKRRFAFSADGARIRANQGHSVEVDLRLEEKDPPEVLYHGTVQRFLPSIDAEGLKKGRRHHVHLSADVATARKVGARRGKPVVLKVDAGRMYQDGYKFFVSANGVWLTDSVPPGYLSRTRPA